MTEIDRRPDSDVDGLAPEGAMTGGLMLGGEAAIDSTVAAGLEVKVRSQWAYARKRFVRHRLAMASLVVLTFFVLVAIFANQLAPYSYLQFDLTDLLHPPTTAGHHFFGTDDIGRDYFSGCILGIRTSLEIGASVALLSTIVGLLVGAAAGYFGGWIDNLLMRITDLVLTLPALAILLVVAALLGQGPWWRVTLILAGFFWTGLSRIVRGLFLSLREKEYVEAAKASGSGNSRIMFRHILPNTLGPIIVNGTLAVATAILTEAALSFLGFGIKATTPSLGKLVSSGQSAPEAWWLTVFPGVIIVLIVLCINFIGDGLRDALDPTQRRVRA
ncbi:MAG TPA: ABC transporter permease [Gaiellaceae bacterium]|nr:ABC transporter permease [Gaiellaceae bacterium]